MDEGDQPEPIVIDEEPSGDVESGRSALFPWILFALAFVMAAVFAWLWYQGRSPDRQPDQVKSVATQFVLALTNFRAETIDRDVARIKGFAVGDFKGQADQVFGPNFFQEAKRAKVQATGRVQSVFIETLSGGNATVFAVANLTFQNASSGGSQSEIVRFDITMIDTQQGWKVENVQLLQSAAPSPFA